MNAIRDPLVGQINPSQLLFTYGVGSIVDLPRMSVIVMGLEDWPTDPAFMREISEPRLLRAVRATLNIPVERLLFPPVNDDGDLPNPFEAEARVGVPVATFPRWMVCPVCRLLAQLSSQLFELKTRAYRMDFAQYIHKGCEKSKTPPTVLPARFLVACENGHLDDFPWLQFVHRNKETDCPGPLRLSEYGPTGEVRDLDVKCDGCGAHRRMAEAFGVANREKMPLCRARRPHLRDYDPAGCKEKMRPIVLGASNGWFPAILSVVAIPEATAELDLRVEENWTTLQTATNRDRLEMLYEIGKLGTFARYSRDALWEAIEHKLAQDADPGVPSSEDSDLQTPEWNVLSNPDPTRNSIEFQLRTVDAPVMFCEQIAQVVLVERMREVQAIVGFSRIDSPGELTEPSAQQIGQLAPLARKKTAWVPAVDVRGEGIFIRFDETRLAQWLVQPAVIQREQEFLAAHIRWRKARGMTPPEARFPSMRYVLLHSFAHTLMRQFALECGYTRASIRERIYSRNADQLGGAMAGVLIYTAAPDSEGTLGGLVSLGEPTTLERHIATALESAGLCASDPTCAEHQPVQTGLGIHAAACHACAFVPETSCERGNRFLDRSVLVETLTRSDLAFFGG
jgi:Domain of unknown function (DUF1998)